MNATSTAHLVGRLIDRLMEVPLGENITYGQLADAIGQDLTPVRYLLYRAFKEMGKDHGIRFETMYGKGYRRLPTEELIKIGQTARRKIRHTARRANENIEYSMSKANDISPTQKVALLREQSVLGMIEEMTKDKSLPPMGDGEMRPLTPGQSARKLVEFYAGKR